MKIIISGFGSPMAKSIYDFYSPIQHEIIILGRKDPNISAVKFAYFDLSDDSLLHPEIFENADVFFHCAAELVDESKMQSVNVDGTKKLINLAKFRLGHWIQLSSAGVYASGSNDFVNEDSDILPNNLYEKTKLEADQLIINAANSGCFNYTIIRPTVVVGYPMKNASIKNLILSVYKKKFFYINSKDAVLNLIPYQIVSKSMVLCAENRIAYNKIFIINKSIKISDLVNLILSKNRSEDFFPVIPSKVLSTIISFLRFIPNFPLTQQRIKHLTRKTVYKGNLIEYELGIDIYENYHEILKTFIMMVISKVNKNQDYSL